jgi:PadR family transcriptional regulator PadR
VRKCGVLETLLTGNRSCVILMLTTNMSIPADVPYGTLDLMVLKTLQTLGPQHGYGVARRIEQMAKGVLALNQGTIYPALLRLEQQGFIRSRWGTSENNRRARFYEITVGGEKHLSNESKQWTRMVTMVSRLLEDEA